LTIGPTVFQGGVIYVEVQPLNQTPIVPRTQIWSAPWAFLAETVGDGSITTAKLADFRSTEPINPGVTTAKLGDGAVTAPKIADGSVTSMKLADGAVENQKLADNSVTAIKISTGAVSTIKMADGCVESAKLANDVGSMLKVSGGMIHFGPWIDQAGTPAFQVNQNLVIKKYNVLLSEGPNVPGGGIGDGTPNAYFFMNADVSGGTYFYQWTNKFIIQSERGPVQINSLVVTGSKSFEIDLPSDPKNKTLTHYCVEAPEAINVYTGTIRTGADGFAEVSLPEYFESLNTDPHYQLTTIGIFSQAIVAKKILGNKFTIQTEKPDVEVSWQVTATRNDRAYNYYKRPNVRLKEQGEKGTYLVPEAYGEPPRFSKAKWRQSK
ncbi:MAG: hypothetical protein JNM34_09700, partial [Chthonomonadaceae bacterium]|nr:hypothetical protein [Chthonomonadaceae bacterium]